MPFYEHSKPLAWDYDKATEGMAERLQILMNMASGEPAGSDLRQVHRNRAQTIYENWRHFSVESGTLKPEDDARFLAILKQWL
jgi:hypothetical protein